MITERGTSPWVPPRRGGDAMRGPENAPRPLTQILYDLREDIEEMRLKPATEPESYPPLSHYTSMSGLQGIIDTKKMWATAYEYLNDETEGIYGIGLLRDAIAQTAEHLTLRRSDDGRFLQDLEQALDAHHDLLVKEATYEQRILSHTCIACFTTKPDQLSQWRGYGNGVGGVSIQFPREVVAELATAPGWRLLRCDYSGQIDTAVVAPIMQRILDLRSRGEHSFTGDVALAAYMEFLLETTSAYVACFKHPKFEEEAEWRLVSSSPRPYNTPPGENDEGWHYRYSDLTLIPYMKVPLNLPDAATPRALATTLQVICGPNPRPLATRKAVQGYLWNRGVDAHVWNSDVPFR